MSADLSALLSQLMGSNGIRPVAPANPVPSDVAARPGFDPTAPYAPPPPPPPPVDETPDPVSVPDPTPIPIVDPEPTPDPAPVPDPDLPPRGTPPSGPPTALDPVGVAGGRVTRLDLADTAAPGRAIARVDITEQPAFGHASVGADRSIDLVLSGEDGTGPIALGYDVTYADGTTESFAARLDVAAPLQEAGWGAGEHYMLETGADGRVVVETGENHRDVYVGGSDAALSRADIAALEGLRTRDIDRDWLLDHPEYGGSAALALDADAGMEVWYALTNPSWPDYAEPGSHWLRLEAGHDYEGLGRVVYRGAMGESDLHPLHVTSWGEGPAPVIVDQVRILQAASENVVFSNVTFGGGVFTLEGSDLLFDDVTFTGAGGATFQHVDRYTIRDSTIEDVVGDAPRNPANGWAPGENRIAGLYAANMDGLLIEDSFVHHNGWRDGYDGTPAAGQPPSMYSHNIYVQSDTTDVTFRDNVVAQGASFGAQLRGGAFVEDNAFVDNNVGLSVVGGDYRGAGPVGNLSLVSGNLVTSAAYKIAPQIGGVSLGLVNEGEGTVLAGNVVAHLADPADPADLARKAYANDALVHAHAPAFDDTIVWNWQGVRNGRPDRGVDGLDPARLDATTIQRYAAEVLGRSDATIDDLMDHLSRQGSVGAGAPVDADAILAWFREGFGIVTPVDASDAHRFAPSEIADGIRWDVRQNWEDGALPGRGDDVDLAGNLVAFGARTEVMGRIELGPDGGLRVSSGRLEAADGVAADAATGGRIEVARAGQLWADGFSGGGLDVAVTGGRLANTGTVAGGVDLAVSGDGQAILGTDGDRFDLDGGSLHVDGARARVGFDGDADGIAVLRAGGGTLSFAARGDGLGQVSEFRSGAFGDAPDVRSGIDLEGGTLRLDLGAGAFEGRHALLRADEIVGRLDAIEVAGLRDDQDLRVVLDHGADVVDLVFGRAGGGTGALSLGTLGRADDARADGGLWAALTEGHDGLDLARGDPDPIFETDLLLI